MEDFTGNKVDIDKLNQAIHIVNEKRKALQRLYNCRKNTCVPISGRDVLLIMQIAFFDDPERLTAQVNTLCECSENFTYRYTDGHSELEDA